MIDLRSDTVTRPCAGMRRAMYNAEVGDDVFGEDPTVNRLQEEVAELLGKEAALFVPSGMMGNQLGVGIQTRPGDEVIVERSCHIFNYESGAAGALSGVVLHPLDGQRGVLRAEQLRGALRSGEYWESPSRLLCLENTLNRAGGRVYPMKRLRELARLAREAGLALHLDGARLWNASAASGIAERDYAALFDSVTVCLSKGLGAPVGSVFCGTRDLVRAAHRMRKLLGAGMRQAGILAAAGLYALTHHHKELAHDHAKARRLAHGIAGIDSLRVEMPETNIVLIHLLRHDVDSASEALRAAGVAVVPFGASTLRATTHRDVSMADMEQAASAMRHYFGARR